MFKTPNDQLLFELIHSMTKSEKRSFKLFAKKNSSQNESKYLMLFDAMEKANNYDEEALLKKLSGVSKSQFANQKSHLYGLVLTSLRLSHLKDDIDIQLREQLDFIRLLYKKGLYFQSLRLLARAKNTTGDYRKDLFQLALLDYEKQIRSQQVFDLEEQYTEQIDRETEEAMSRFGRVQKFFGLASRMKARFIEKGMVKNEQEMNNLRALFYRNLPEYDEEKMAFNEQFYLYRAFYWFSYLTYDFGNCVHYAEKWVHLFQETGLHQKRKSGFLKGLNRLLQSAFRVNDKDKFEQYFVLFDAFESDSGTLNSNTLSLMLKYRTIQSLNRVFLFADFDQQQEQTDSLLKQVDVQQNYMDKHNLLVIYYKAGVFFFAQSDYAKARHYLSLLIDDNDSLRNDLKGFARLLMVLVDYDSGDDTYIERKIRAAYLHFEQHQSLNVFQEVFMDFLKESGNTFPQELNQRLRELKNRLSQLDQSIFNKKLQLYFDLNAWIEAKIENKTFKEVIQEKAKEN